MKYVEILKEFYSPEDDKIFKSSISDTRRPRITLRHLNKLRQMRDVKRQNNAEHLEFVSVMYGSNNEEQ